MARNKNTVHVGMVTAAFMCTALLFLAIVSVLPLIETVYSRSFLQQLMVFSEGRQNVAAGLLTNQH